MKGIEQSARLWSSQTLTSEDSYVMVLVSVWTTGSSLVEISSFDPPGDTLPKLMVSVFTADDCTNGK